jgi:hypothetical protein
MNKRQVIASLNKIANELDTNGLYSEATSLTKIMNKLAMDENDEYNMDELMPDDVRYFDDEEVGEDEPMSPEKKKEMFIEGMDVLDNIFRPQGGGTNMIDDLMESYNVDIMNPNYGDLIEVFRELDDKTKEEPSYFEDTKMKFNGKMLNYRQIKSRLLRLVD